MDEKSSSTKQCLCFHSIFTGILLENWRWSLKLYNEKTSFALPRNFTWWKEPIKTAHVSVPYSGIYELKFVFVKNLEN